MNRLTVRSAMAFFLLLTALLLPLTCAAAEETYTYHEYSWDESTGALKTDVVSKKLGEMTQIKDSNFWDLGGNDQYFYYLPAADDSLPIMSIRIQGNVSVLFLRSVEPEDRSPISVILDPGSTLNMYTPSSGGVDLREMHFFMGDGSTLNLHSSMIYSTFTSYYGDSGDPKLPTVNLYQPLSNATDCFLNLNNIIFNDYGPFHVGQLCLNNTTFNLYNDIYLMIRIPPPVSP